MQESTLDAVIDFGIALSVVLLATFILNYGS